MIGNAKYVRHSYKVERVKKVYTVYQLVNASSKAILTELIRIEQFRKYSRGTGFDDYLRLKNTSNWKTSEQVTGLHKTSHPDVFYGDRLHYGKKNLIVFKFSNNKETLTIDYYLEYYPTKGDLKTILSKYM